MILILIGRWGTSDNFNGLGDIGAALGEGWKIDHLAHFPSQTDPCLYQIFHPEQSAPGEANRLEVKFWREL